MRCIYIIEGLANPPLIGGPAGHASGCRVCRVVFSRSAASPLDEHGIRLDPFLVTRTVTLEASLDDMKLVYRSLHAHLAEHLELMDSEIFAELQRRLQESAKAEGVDIADHAAWDTWLGNEGALPCDERMKQRRNLS
jgi:hypothetical protein